VGNSAVAAWVYFNIWANNLNGCVFSTQRRKAVKKNVLFGEDVAEQYTSADHLKYSNYSGRSYHRKTALTPSVPLSQP